MDVWHSREAKDGRGISKREASVVSRALLSSAESSPPGQSLLLLLCLRKDSALS